MSVTIQKRRLAPVKQVGVQGVRRVLGYSKKDLLLFSKLHILGLQRQLSGPASTDAGVMADYEYLAEAGYLCHLPEVPEDLTLEAYARLRAAGRTDPRLMAIMTGDLEDLASIPRFRMLSCMRHPSNHNGRKRVPPGGELAVAYAFGVTGEQYVPIIDSVLSANQWQRVQRELFLPKEFLTQDASAGVIDLVLDNLPVPGDGVPLDAILEFSRDDDTRRKLAGLDIWMRKAAHSGKDLQDIALEIEESLHEFSNYMRLADMRCQTSGLRMMMSLPLGIIEELLHLKPKGALDVVFEYRDRKANRFEAELSAPGGALAYIYEAEKRFG